MIVTDIFFADANFRENILEQCKQAVVVTANLDSFVSCQILTISKVSEDTSTSLRRRRTDDAVDANVLRLSATVKPFDNATQSDNAYDDIEDMLAVSLGARPLQKYEADITKIIIVCTITGFITLGFGLTYIKLILFISYILSNIFLPNIKPYSY